MGVLHMTYLYRQHRMPRALARAERASLYATQSSVSGADLLNPLPSSFMP
jgi:hypothetical protein